MQIRQIIPAEGWYAVYIDLEEESYDLYPLAAWALIEPELPSVHGGDVSEQVIGLDADRSDTVGDAAQLHIRAGKDPFGFFEYVHQKTLDNPRKLNEVAERITRYIAGQVAANGSPEG